MFDFAWSEIALIGVVALIAIGPKDLPVAMKTVGELVKKARKMAGEFQTHVDEMVREANLHEVRDTISDIRRMDIKGKILDAVDGDKTLRNTLNESTFRLDAASGTSSATPAFQPDPPPVPVHDAVPEQAVAERPEHAIAAPEPDGRPPSFLPPAIIAAGKVRTVPPAFVPPAAVAARALAARAPVMGHGPSFTA